MTAKVGHTVLIICRSRSHIGTFKAAFDYIHAQYEHYEDGFPAIRGGPYNKIVLFALAGAMARNEMFMQDWGPFANGLKKQLDKDGVLYIL